MSGSNPFDDGKKGPVDPFASAGHRKSKTATNPYEFDAQFDKKKTPLDREALMGSIDATDATSGTTFQRKPNILKSSHRASTVGAEMQRFTSSILGGMHNPAAGVSFVSGGNKGGKDIMLVTKKKIPLARWPYDDYHLTQKVFYEKLEEKEEAKAKGGSDTASAQGKGDGPNNAASSIPVLSRPNDPPEIRHAVVGLPLTDFEAKAEERGISIVSTWLFDAGLIDELLVNGGMSSAVIKASNNNNMGGNGMNGSSTIASADSAEGVEIGALGHVIEGSNKMDKEIAKLRSATQRQLTLINSRLNDGVAASGSEVSELVNAVNSTRDDLGRLRELSSYVSNAGDVDNANNFMVQNYPLLKNAVHARKNLGRCFRELGFFSQIPDTCERLREQLYAGEYTAHEWTNLRNVCREHVELEIILVEAEVGMKQRLADVAAHHSSDGSRPPPSIRGGKFGQQAFSDRGAGLAHNKAEVDHFLKEHVKNVWELGDEIRIRLLSGIGAAFDLAMNNPAGMVALVEAVEVYETASEEYKQVHGVEAGSIQNLRFTDMRSAALSSLYKDMEVRGMDVFKDLAMQVCSFVCIVHAL